MKIRVFNDTLVNGQWTGTGVGDFEPNVAQHLIDIGNAEPYETKVLEGPEVKKARPSSASRVDRALTNQTVKSPAKRQRKGTGKRSRSTTAGE